MEKLRDTLSPQHNYLNGLTALTWKPLSLKESLVKSHQGIYEVRKEVLELKKKKKNH